jgi:tRNA pseudouridine55 synthase
MASSEAAAPDGVLVVDKPSGPTSHDVVARVRRALGTRRVGHAGTLDPMASGVLIVLVGEATKLAPYLTAHEKRYDARVTLGRATDTLDALGAVTDEAELPAWLVDELAAIEAGHAAPRIEAALAAERERKMQAPPAFSAIKVKGQKSYDRARRGEEVELAERPIEVADLRVRRGSMHAGEPCAALDVSLSVSKGYYVRSLARDLGAALSVPAHLSALRRTQSGPFGLDRATPLASDASVLKAALLPVAAAAALSLPTAHLTEQGLARAVQGKRLQVTDFLSPVPSGDRIFAWLSSDGRLVAVGNQQHDSYVVQRGFTSAVNRSGSSAPSAIEDDGASIA